MENASKALLMAGGVLVGMLIIVVMVILFNTYGQLGKTYEARITENQIKELNSNFIKFERRNNITIQEIASIANFAKQYQEDTGIDIKVVLSGKGDLTENFDIVSLIQGQVNNNQYYKCSGILYDNYGKVKYIKFILR